MTCLNCSKIMADAAYLEGEIDRLRAALDEANTERQWQKHRADDFEGRYETSHASRMWAEECFRRAEAERDLAVATAARWEDRANRLEKSAGPTLDCRQ